MSSNNPPPFSLAEAPMVGSCPTGHATTRMKYPAAGFNHKGGCDAQGGEDGVLEEAAPELRT